MLSIELTNNDSLRSHLASRVRHVIVDEYQDVNPIQEAIVWSLHELGAGLCVVGDDDQTIYQWRGSNVENILTFQQRYPEVKQIRLEDNFRSSEGIIETARVFIEQNSGRLPKQMKPANAQPYEAGDIVRAAILRPRCRGSATSSETAQALHGVAFKEPTENDPNTSAALHGRTWRFFFAASFAMRRPSLLPSMPPISVTSSSA